MPVYHVIQLLRIPFSYYLTPVFLFALSMAETYNMDKIVLLFIALHLFIYPASNAYNSFMDQDESSVGGLKNPPKAGNEVFYVSIVFDLIGLGICYYISIYLCFLVLGYVIVSRAYSWHGIRLKKYPLISFLTVFVFQGAYIYALVFVFTQDLPLYEIILQNNFAIPALISSMNLAGIYPLTQVYQHKADEKAGDYTFSRWLGIRGTFEFSAVCFAVVAILMGYHFTGTNQSHLFYIFMLFIFPVVAYFLWWAAKVWMDVKQANFRYTMILNKVASTSLNLYFLSIIAIKHFHELPL
ncbi:MAG: UbiA prenyltransferase family protein [Bacteroidia bacterium]|nr:UbiA prenyltransferase family protein [Bacteroidia bacterium]